MLLQFRREQGGAALEIRAALHANDLGLATRTAHNLKGVAANLGAVLVSQQTGELEKRLRGQALDDLEGPLGLIERSLERLCHELSVLEVEPAGVKKECQSFDRETLASEAEAIRPLLESDLEQAMIQADSLLERYSESPLGDLLHRLQDALQSFDTDTASIHLDEIGETLKLHG